MAAAGPIIAIAGTALSVAGTLSSANAQAKQANIQASVARQQAAFQRQQADFNRQQAERERLLGEQESQRFRREQSAALASLRARRAGANVDITGTPLLTEDILFGDLLLGAETIRRQGLARASEIISGASAREIEANAADARARIQGIEARSARTQGFLKAGQTLLTSAGKSF